MTETRDQRVYAIVYSNDSRTELAERIVMLEDENVKLREKNMLLAVAKRGIRACYDNLSEQYDELEAENVKLRELVVDMGELLPFADWHSVEKDERASACLCRMEELGIEADE